MWCAIIYIYIYLRVVIKNKPKNIFHCIWHFLTHTFLEIAINAQTVHHSQIKVMSPLWLPKVAEVTLLFQGGAGRDTEVILSAMSCSPFPFPCLIHWGRAFVMAAASQPGSIWGTELMFTSHNSFVTGNLVYGSCLCPWQELELDGPWGPFQPTLYLILWLNLCLLHLPMFCFQTGESSQRAWKTACKPISSHLHRGTSQIKRHQHDVFLPRETKSSVNINCLTSAIDQQPSDPE